MTEQFFHSNEIEGVNLESLEESELATPNFVSPNLSSKNSTPIKDLEETIFDHIIDQEVQINEKSDQESNKESEE